MPGPIGCGYCLWETSPSSHLGNWKSEGLDGSFGLEISSIGTIGPVMTGGGEADVQGLPSMTESMSYPRTNQGHFTQQLEKGGPTRWLRRQRCLWLS